MISSLGHLRVWAYHRVKHYIIQRLFQSYLQTPSRSFFWKLSKFKIRHCKNFQCPVSKIRLHYQIGIVQNLTVFYQLLSWTSVRTSKYPIDKMIGSQDHWGSQQFLECDVYYLRTPSQNFFWKSLKFKIRHCKNFQSTLTKISLHSQTVIDQRLTVFN